MLVLCVVTELVAVSTKAAAHKSTCMLQVNTLRAVTHPESAPQECSQLSPANCFLQAFALNLLSLFSVQEGGVRYSACASTIHRSHASHTCMYLA